MASASPRKSLWIVPRFSLQTVLDTFQLHRTDRNTMAPINSVSSDSVTLLVPWSIALFMLFVAHCQSTCSAIFQCFEKSLRTNSSCLYYLLYVITVFLRISVLCIPYVALFPRDNQTYFWLISSRLASPGLTWWLATCFRHHLSTPASWAAADAITCCCQTSGFSLDPPTTRSLIVD